MPWKPYLCLCNLLDVVCNFVRKGVFLLTYASFCFLLLSDFMSSSSLVVFVVVRCSS